MRNTIVTILAPSFWMNLPFKSRSQANKWPLMKLRVKSYAMMDLSLSKSTSHTQHTCEMTHEAPYDPPTLQIS